MPVKSFTLDNLGPVTVYKRRGSRSIRLSVNSDGKIKVTMPTWLPYQAGLTFATQKQDWLKQQLPQPLKNGDRIGKFHVLVLQTEAGSKIKTSVKGNEATVIAPATASAASIQTSAQAVAKRALKLQADRLLPQRIQDIANTYNMQYRQLHIRHLKSRWGSCSSEHKITLNYYLMQLPWELIDYVIVHELAHTIELNHSRQFWSTVEKMSPDYKSLRKQLKNYQPSVLSAKP